MKDSDVEAAIDAMLAKSVPEMIAPLIVYLCTEQASNVNGRTFWVGGGDIGLYSEPDVIAKIHKDGVWTLDELLDQMPKKVTKGLTADALNPIVPQ